MTADQVLQVSKTKYPELIAQAFNDTCAQFEINTLLRKQHFLAQLLHESNCFKNMEELSSGAQYEFRADLGNTKKGWGRLYKGRGPLQTTGYYNYKKLTEFCQKKSKELLQQSILTVNPYEKDRLKKLSIVYNVDFINNPEILAQNPYSFIGSGFFWQSKNINKYADKDSVFWVSAMVNGLNSSLATEQYKKGQPNHLAERTWWLNYIKKNFKEL